MININEVTMIAGSSRVFAFPRTAKLTYFHIKPGDMSIRTEGTDRWPALNIGSTHQPANQSATLYVFRNIESKWYCAPAERLRPNQLNGSKPVATEGMHTLIGNGWFGKPEFGILSRNNPAFGEPVGFMIVAGSTRLDDRTPLEARTQIIVCAYGSEEPMRVLWQEGDNIPHPTPEPTPEPIPTPNNDILRSILESQADVIASLNRLIDSQVAIQNNLKLYVEGISQQTYAGSISFFGRNIDIELVPKELKPKV